jgi:hypothetical protein
LLVTQEFMRLENSENLFLNKFIGLMESPLDETCIIHTEPELFYQLYELNLQEYSDVKTKAEDAKKKNISILNYSQMANKDELLS